MVYPHELERDVALADGTRVHLRPIRAGDEPRLIALYDRLSRQTAYQQFFTVMRRLPPNWAHFLADVDYVRRLALVATRGASPDGDLIAVARYAPTGEPATAEVAFVVEDGWQNKGLGTVLLRELLKAAGQRGIKQFRAYVLADNSRMIDLITRFGDVQQRTLQQGVVELLFSVRATPRVSGHG